MSDYIFLGVMVVAFAVIFAPLFFKRGNDEAELSKANSRTAR